MGPRTTALVALWLICTTGVGLNGSLAALAVGPDEPLLSVDHSVPHISTIPAIAGEPVELYVREQVLPGFGRPVVLMVHAAFLSLDAYYDVPIGDYSWMDYLAKEIGRASCRERASRSVGARVAESRWPYRS